MWTKSCLSFPILFQILHIQHPLLETPPDLSLHEGWGNAVAIQFAKFLDDQPRSKEVYDNSTLGV